MANITVINFHVLTIMSTELKTTKKTDVKISIVPYNAIHIEVKIHVENEVVDEDFEKETIIRYEIKNGLLEIEDGPVIKIEELSDYVEKAVHEIVAELENEIRDYLKLFNQFVKIKEKFPDTVVVE